MDEQKIVGYDASGFEVLTKAVLSLLSGYPGLKGREILFEELGESSGLAFSADSGALILSETEDILGTIRQECRYPFFVVYRTASTRERQKLQVQDFLDSLGKYLCGEMAIVDGQSIRLTKYPILSDGRKIYRITRSNSYGLDPSESGVQDWLLPITVQYTNEFYLEIN